MGWLTYEYYKFDSPERSWTTDLSVFATATDFGRRRAYFNTTFKLELVKDLYWKMNFYVGDDNKPISSRAATIDDGLTTAVGFKF